MAPGMAIASEGGDNNIYNGKITAFVILSCMMAGMGGVIFGYDIGISGGVTSMEPFLEKFFPEVHRKMKEDTKISNYCKFDSQLLTSFTSSLYVAGLVASFVASSVTRAFGRKPSVLMGGAAFLAGSALGGAAVNVYMLIFGRLLLGVGVGFANQSVPLYLSEMAPARYRGAINNGFQFSIGIGALAANFINYGTEQIKGGWGWRVSLALAAVPASILTLGALFLPETPNSLIQRKSDHQKAKLMLQRVRGTNDVQAEFDDLLKASSTAKTINHPFKKIIQRKYRPQLVMATAIPFFQQVTGINVIAFYAPLLFRTIGLGVSASLLSSVFSGIVGAGSTLISMFIVDRLGRKKLFLIGGIQMFVSQVIIGGVMAVQLGDQGTVSKGYSIVVLILICVYVAGFGWSWGPLGWLVPSEIFQLEIRSAGQSITVAVSFVFTFIVAQTFLAMLCHFKAGIFFFFGGWVVVMTAFMQLLLPETKNVPIEQMDGVWREHWFWKKYVGEVDEQASMAVGLAISSEGGQDYNGKITSFVVLSCIVAATGGLIFGYDLGISGGVTSMEPFLEKFFPKVYRKMKEDTHISNYCKFDSQLLTSFTSSLYIAGLIASLFASTVTKAFGRRASILVGGTAFLAGSALGGAALNIYMLIFGRSVPLYLSEMAPPKYRGTFNIGFQLCGAIGVLSANLLNYGTQKIKGGWGWRISLAMAAAPASILTIGAIFLPETPNSIIQRSNDHQKAQKMLQRVRGIADVEAELNDLIRASSISKSITHPFKNIMLVSQVMIGSIMAAQLVMVCLYSSGYCYSWGPLAWLVPSEIFPLEIRSAGQSITVAVNFLFTFLTAQTFLPMLCHFKAGIFFFFGGLVLIMTTFMHFFLPETKNVPIEQMDKVWREHWFWMKIVEDVGEESKKIQQAL
ncbi:hypothetical protein CUMW_218890 [Citrus unshiu]|uniref:Major facilitator superfamily (MFS) profile domain-containing protein n=1 Tax=Citrus unshiu TaxID=55188 RepID=A0A2H5QD70_CITUN|nr:hypothetical protein CUMW_218890 [Citrus unshiu]